MNFSKEALRSYVFTRWKLGKKATEIRNELLEVYPTSCPSLETISRWIGNYIAGSTDLKDSGRPKLAVTKTICTRARAIINEDPTISLRFLSLELGVSYGSTYTIVHEELALKKKCTRWIPHLLSDDQKKHRVQICKSWMAMFEPNGQKLWSDVATGDECWISFLTNKTKQSNMVWMSEDEPDPLVLKTGFRSRKRMLTIFFNSQGPICVDIMPQGSTITANYYTDAVLPLVLQHCNTEAQ